MMLTLILSFFVCIGFSFAQGNPGPQMDQKMTAEQKAQKLSAKLEKSLSLTADQKTQVYEVTLEKIQKTREVKSKDAKDKKSQGEKYKSIRRDFNTDMKEILTDEQEVKWEQLKKEAKARREAKKAEAGLEDSKTDNPEKDLDLELE